MGKSSSTAAPVVSPFTCEAPIKSSKESKIIPCLSLEETVNLLNTEVIANQAFIVDQVLTLKQSLKDSIQEKSPGDLSFEF